MDQKLVSVIIVNYYGKNVLEKCLESVFLSSYHALEVIVVDNSSDTSVEDSLKKFNVVLLRSGRNLGYCGGNNFGVRRAKGEYVLFLNYDTVLHPDTISQLVKETVKSQAPLCQPKILMMDNPRKINSAGVLIHLAGFGLLRGCDEEDLGQYDNLEEICAPHGACIFASKNAFQSLGYFDEHFFAFNEDTDLGWKALIMGKNTRYVPSAIIYHKWGHSWDKPRDHSKLYLAERNRLIMILTNYQRSTMVLLLPILILAELSTLAYCAIQGMLRSKVRGYVDLIQSRQYLRARRRWIHSVRKRDDASIIKSFTWEYKHTLFGKPYRPLNVVFHLLSSFLMRFTSDVSQQGN
jgi:GT2 family glycosyltransferase